MSLARDCSEFADQVNADLDSIVNDMAAASQRADAIEKRVDKLGEDRNDLMGRIFERLGGIDERLTVIQNGFVEDLKDLRYRVTKLENNGNHPAEEVTPPRPRPSLPR